MSVHNPIEAICKIIDSPVKPKENEQVHKLDANYAPVTNFLTRTRYRFWTRTHATVELGALSININDFRANVNIDVNLRLKIWLLEDGLLFAQQMAKTEKLPREFIRTQIESFVQTQSTKREDATISQWIVNSQNDIEKQLQIDFKSIGLGIEAVFELDQYIPKTKAINVTNVKVRTKDTSELVNIGVDIRIDPIEAQTSRGPTNLIDWQDILKQWLSAFIERNISLQQYYFETTFAQQIEKHLTKQLQNIGWNLIRIEITKDQPNHPSTISDIFDIAWTSMLGKKLDFKVKLNMEIVDYRLYYHNNKPDLKQTGQDILERSFQEALLSEDIKRFSPDNINKTKDDIEAIAAKKAKAIGLKIVTLLPDPQFDALVLLKNRVYKVPTQSYDTQSPGQQARFSIVVEGRVEGIEDAFTIDANQSSLEKQIANVINEKLTLTMREIDFSDYLLRFRSKLAFPTAEEINTHKPDYISSQTNLQITNQTSQSVSGYLKQIIQEELKKRLKLVTSEISITPEDSKLQEATKKINSLATQNPDLKVIPAGMLGKEHEITFKVEYKLKAFSTGDALVNLALNDNIEPKDFCRSINNKIIDLLAGYDFSSLEQQLQSENKDEFIESLNFKLSATLSSFGYTAIIIILNPTDWGEYAKVEYDNTNGNQFKKLKGSLEIVDTEIESAIQMKKQQSQEYLKTHEALNNQHRELIKSESSPLSVEKKLENMNKNIHKSSDSIKALGGNSNQHKKQPNNESFNDNGSYSSFEDE